MRVLLIVALLALPSLADAQALSLTGTYRVGPVRDYSCSLEAAPIAADSVRLQLYCNLGAPTYNSGFIDERLPLPARGREIDFRPSGETGPCEIRVRFESSRAIVTQKGSSLECGLGASVTMAGTYIRTSHRRPPFDLNPIG